MRKKSAWKDLRLCIHIMGKRKGFFFLAILGFCILDACAGILSPIGMQKLIQGLQNANQSEIVQGFLWIVAVIVAFWIYMPIGQYLLDQVHNRTMREYKDKFVQHTMRLPMNYYDKTPTGDILSLFSNDMQCLSSIVHWNLEQMLQKISGGIAGLLAMFYLQPAFSLVVLSLGSLSVFTTKYFSSRMWEKGQELQQKRSINTCSIYEHVKSAKNIRLLKLEESKMQQTDKYLEEEEKVNRAVGRLSGKQEALTAGINVFTYLGMIACGSLFVSKGWLDWATVVALIGLKGMTDDLFLEFPQLYTQLKKNLAGAGRIFDVMEKKEWSEERKQYEKIETITQDTSDASIEMQHVDFAYDNENYVLKDFSMKVKEHSLTLLEGESGSGKSTLIKLLLGFYQITSGRIQINSDNIAYVPQNPCLFAGSIYENLTCAKPDASEKEVWQALKLAGAEEFVNELPEGVFSKLLEDGNGLSGGQKQRLALARALLKDAKILLLDEVTSALDSEHARNFLHTLESLKQQKTILFVTHDRSMEELADEVIRI